MLHYCQHCEYKSNHKWLVRRHMNAKHKQHQIQSQSRAPTSMSVGPNTQYGYDGSTSHQHVSNPHPYVHPYLNNANQQRNTYPQQ